MKRVTGLGGVFFKVKDPEKMRDWYEKHLGIPHMSKYGGNFEWRHKEEPEAMGYTAWSVMDEKTQYYQPSEATFMINYRVDDLESLLKQLKPIWECKILVDLVSHGNGHAGEVQSF